MGSTNDVNFNNDKNEIFSVERINKLIKEIIY